MPWSFIFLSSALSSNLAPENSNKNVGHETPLRKGEGQDLRDVGKVANNEMQSLLHISHPA